MKLATYRTEPLGRTRTGVLVETGSGTPWLADLAAGLVHAAGGSPDEHALARALARVPADLAELLALGPVALDDARRVLDHVAGHPDAEALRAAGVLVPADAVDYLPVVARPGKVICAGLNYADHVDETSGMEAPARPLAFAKFASSLIGHDAPVVYPAETEQLDYEGELALVIGTPAMRVATGDALGHVAGYTILHDISSRDVQFAEMEAGMLLLGKNAHRATSVGPFFVTADEVGDPHDLTLEVRVNGEVRQSASTKDLIFGCDELVAYWSATGLEPGDVISTGSPAGVGIFSDPPEAHLLRPGDVVEITIERLGTLRNRIAA